MRIGSACSVTRRAALALTLAVACALAAGEPARAQDGEPPADPPAQPARRAVEVSADAAAALRRAAPHLRDAGLALRARDWEQVLAAFTAAVEELEPFPVFGGLIDQGLYNMACAHARLGRPADAARLFARSIEHGLRPGVFETASGWFEGDAVLRLEHVLVDADLDPIREEPAYVDALRPYLRAGEPAVSLVGDAAGARVPAVIALAPEGADAERALPAWRKAAESGPPLVLVALAGPVRPRPQDRRWLLEDGDDRWAVAKLRETLDALAADARVDPARVFIAAADGNAAEAAWAAALADSGRVAGVAVGGGAFHAEWHADAIASLVRKREGAAPWRVLVGAKLIVAAEMLREGGAEVATWETTDAEAGLEQAALKEWLR